MSEHINVPASTFETLLSADTVKRIRDLITWVDNSEAQLNPKAQRPTKVAIELDQLVYDIEVEVKQRTDISMWRAALEAHHDAFPGHGIQCVHMDQFARELRQMLQIPDGSQVPNNELNAWLNGPQNKLKGRIRYIFGMVSRSMDRL